MIVSKDTILNNAHLFALRECPMTTQNSVASSATLAQRQSLLQNLRALGVVAGDVLWVHSSLRSLGPVDGGADTVITALQEAVTTQGALLMPAFNLVERSQRSATWQFPDTPSTVGYITERFRQLPNVIRSDHYSHSVAAWGRDASWYVQGHRDDIGMDSPWDLAPWGRTFGNHSPFARMIERDAKQLMLGVDYHSATFAHFVEVLAWHRRRQDDPQAAYYYIDRNKLGSWWDSQGQVQTGLIAQAPCRLFDIKPFVERSLAHVLEQPKLFFKSFGR